MCWSSTHKRRSSVGMGRRRRPIARSARTSWAQYSPKRHSSSGSSWSHQVIEPSLCGRGRIILRISFAPSLSFSMLVRSAIAACSSLGGTPHTRPCAMVQWKRSIGSGGRPCRTAQAFQMLNSKAAFQARNSRSGSRAASIRSSGGGLECRIPNDRIILVDRVSEAEDAGRGQARIFVSADLRQRTARRRFEIA